MTFSASGAFGQTLDDIFDNVAAIDWPSGTWKVALYSNTKTPNFDTDTGYNTTNEITGTGYTAGGGALGTPTLTVASPATVLKFDANDTAWTTATFTARGCEIYQDDITTPVADPLLFAVTFGADFSVTAGTFSILWPAAGIASLDYA